MKEWRWYVIRRISTGEFYSGKQAPPVRAGGRATHTFSPQLSDAVRFRQHPLRVVMPRLLRIFWRDLEALRADTLEPFTKWKLTKRSHAEPPEPPTG